MKKITLLSVDVINKISAGEVIERPCSVVKELLENSIDAKSTSISIEIKNGGISLIKVIDNGFGIHKDEVLLAFQKHSTSKIETDADLESIYTHGFRGEALASISAISNLEILTKQEKASSGMIATLEAGILKESHEINCQKGTTILVKNLFFNTPARFNFLKKDAFEANYIQNIITKIALIYPEITFKFTNNNIEIFNTPGNFDFLSTIFALFGQKISENIIEVKHNNEFLNITGFVGNSQTTRGNRNYQSVYVNKRYIKDKIIFSAIDEAYKEMIMKSNFAFVLLNLEINPSLIDVNVHPSKLEVRFSNEKEIYRQVYFAIKNALTLQNRSFYNFQNNSQNEFFSSNKYYQTSNDFKHSKEINKKEEDIVFQTLNKKHDIFNQSNLFANKNICFEECLEKKSEEKSSIIFYNFKIIGQIFFTYILIQQENQFILIDQHAAHERILFEKIKKDYQTQNKSSQMTIEPIIIELNEKELDFVKEKGNIFQKFGFIYDFFVHNSLLIRAVPFNETLKIEPSMTKKTFLMFLDFLFENEELLKTDIEEFLYKIACKLAIKANNLLSDFEIKELINKLNCIENPFSCPHGRPILIKLSKNDLEKMFKRIP